MIADHLDRAKRQRSVLRSMWVTGGGLWIIALVCRHGFDDFRSAVAPGMVGTIILLFSFALAWECRKLNLYLETRDRR